MTKGDKFCCLLVVLGFIGIGLMSRYYKAPYGLLIDTVKKSPNEPRINHVVGTEYLRQGRLMEALEHFATAIRLAPSYPEPYNNIGIVRLELSNSKDAYFITRKDYPNATALLERDYEINPTKEEYLIMGGNSQLGGRHGRE